MADEVTEGQNSEQGSAENDVELIYAEKNLGIYLAETYESIKRAVFTATCRLSLSARAVFSCYDAHAGFSYPGKLGGKQIAELCGISMGTFYKAKKELLEKGLLYRIPKAHANYPDRIYVSDVLHERFVSQNLVNGNPVDRNLTNGEVTYNHIGGTQTHTKVLKPSVIKELPKDLEVSYNTSFSSKESDPYALDAAFDETHNVTHEELDFAFDERVIDPEPIKPQEKKLPNFKLTPPGSSKKLPEKRVPKKFRGSRPIPDEMISLMVGFCYGIKTTQQWTLADRTVIGRCSTAILKLVGAGADLTQFDEFKRRWKERQWMENPSPEMVVRNWFKVMGIKERKQKKAEEISAIAEAATQTNDELFRVNRMLFIQGLERTNYPQDKRAAAILRWEQEHRHEYQGGAQ